MGKSGLCWGTVVAAVAVPSLGLIQGFLVLLSKFLPEHPLHWEKCIQP